MSSTFIATSNSSRDVVLVDAPAAIIGRPEPARPAASLAGARPNPEARSERRMNAWETGVGCWRPRALPRVALWRNPPRGAFSSAVAPARGLASRNQRRRSS